MLWHRALIASFALVLSLSVPALAQDATPQPGQEQPGQEQPGAGSMDEEEGDGAEPERRRERRERGGRGGRGFGGMGLQVEQLKEQLGLSDEQVQKLTGMQEEMRAEFEGFREKMRSGELDRGAMREYFQGMRTKVEGKVKEVLTPEQYKKWEESRPQFGRGRGRDGRDGRGRRGEELGRRLREEAVKSLALGEEESAVVLPLLDGVLETKKLLIEDQEQRRQNFLEKVRATTDAAALQKLLEEFRAARAQDQETVNKSQTALREVLTVEQEAKLVGLNILD